MLRNLSVVVEEPVLRVAGRVEKSRAEDLSDKVNCYLKGLLISVNVLSIFGLVPKP